MRIAIVHDWIIGLRGGEKVLHDIVTMFPEADIYTLIYEPGTTTALIDSRNPVASAVSTIPFVRSHHRLFPWLYPLSAELIVLKGYDLVISSSHSFAKGVTVEPPTPHLCYCHTPIRYAWGQEEQYFGHGIGRFLVEFLLLRWLRSWDRRTSSTGRVGAVLANSEFIAKRIERAWNREARVIYPGIDVANIPFEDGERGPSYLLVGTFVPYKREDLVIEAFRALRLPLVVIGDGPGRRRLERGAPPNVQFRRYVSDDTRNRLYGECQALIYPQEEDFGITAVEAQAAGAPVIAYGAGGALETVIPRNDPEGRAATGLFFHSQTPEALAEAVRSFEADRHEFSATACRVNAARFSREEFKCGFLAEVERLLMAHPTSGRRKSATTECRG